VSKDNQNTSEPGGDVTSASYNETHQFASGAVSSMTVVVQYVRDDKGNVTGSVKTTIVSYTSADGEYGSQDVTIEECDNENNCTVVASGYEDSDTVDDEEYYNPDADPTIVTVETYDKVLRTRGAAVKVMNGWAAPGFENDPANPKNPGLVSLIDSDLSSTFLVVSPLRVTKAQPETRDDLPQPGQAAPRGGGCGLFCG
jgi:hypothetical protein